MTFIHFIKKDNPILAILVLVAELPGNVFWREPFAILCEPKQLVEFVVMDIELVADSDRRHVAGHAQISNKVNITS